LLALLAYTDFAQKQSPGKKDFFLALVFFALALLAKPMLVTLPFVLLLLDHWPLRRITAGGRPLAAGRRLALEKWPFFLLAAVSCVVTFLAQRRQAVVALQQLPFDLRLENAVISCAGYLCKTVWPAKLAVFYPLPEKFSTGRFGLSAAVLAVVSLLVWRWRRQRCLLTGWLWFLGTLVPVIGLVQVGEQSSADRYTYLPAVGLFVAVAFGIAEAQARLKFPARSLRIAPVLILLACIAATENQLRFWRDTETLFTRTLAVTKNNGPAHMMLGVAFERQGRQDDALQQYHDALACDASAIVQVAGGEKRPLAAHVQLLLGQAAEHRADANEALAHYREALRLDANLVEAHNNLGNLLDQLGKPDEALAHYRAALRLRPESPLLHENLGTQLDSLGRFDDALREYQEAARLAPASPQPFYLMGKAWLRRGQSREAIAAFETALQRDSEDSPSLTYLARVLAADASPQIRNGTRAVALAEKANLLTGGKQPFVLGTLAMAYAEAGRFGDARAAAQSAIQLTPADGKENISGLEAQLRFYESNQPFHETATSPATPARP
jgi:tetratricopeptide (TPR) repeat protein